MNLTLMRRVLFLVSLAVATLSSASKPQANNGHWTTDAQPQHSSVFQFGIRLHRLGHAPLCEASALVLVGNHFLVADNEVHDKLFRFDRNMVAQEVLRMPPSDRPRDIEALAYNGEQLLVVGSHSPKTDGSRRQKRHRTRLLRVDGGILTPIAAFETADIESGQSACVRGLFGPATPADATRFCHAVARTGSINIEGAAVIQRRFWIGFRWPLLDGKAVIGRLSSSAELQIDQLILTDLHGQGIRAMDASIGSLHVIGGPVTDQVSAHTLYRIDDKGNAQSLMELPPSSEGLALTGPREAMIVIDGAEGPNAGLCRRSAQWTAARW